MHIEVISVDDETGKVEIDLDNEARDVLINLGFNALLTKAAKEFLEEENDV